MPIHTYPILRRILAVSSSKQGFGRKRSGAS